ncbi:FtsB family cell division protein [Adhaeribacter rhizoryzae]|uniref:Septum formation initiator family protein n=1 Tax=Adhaeribacter rhizoryzae TaxID=2607907 RepID=A0A5M6DSZ0_9BACT|nr:septum formation initiator family protein [Adhaeribacter rhizoryzae]KAA5549416.1 septum formation initiator family protein [Adhaeribacter rhizoryzae]
MLARIPKFFRSFYFLFTTLFLVWMFFFDSNDFVTQYQMSKKLSELEDEKEHYQQRIAQVQEDRQELLSNSQLLEKYAREKYQMKKPTEDLFIIMKKEDKGK